MAPAERQTNANLQLNSQDVVQKQPANSEKPDTFGGHLIPNSQANTPATFPNENGITVTKLADKYLLHNQMKGNIYRHCVHIESSKKYFCKVVPTKNYQDVLRGYVRLGSHPGINPIEEVIVDKSNTYIMFHKCYGDLLSYYLNSRRLPDTPLSLFRQMAHIVAACHSAGIILRDLKLSSFIFKNQEKKEIMLLTLDNAVVLEGDDDCLSDKHGCPPYAGPEILSPTSHYSGRPADCWSLGVLLYILEVGTYPFFGTDPRGILRKIRSGCCTIPEHVSPLARCLIRGLLRVNPSERLTAQEVLDLPWWKSSKGFVMEVDQREDQIVPVTETRVEGDSPLIEDSPLIGDYPLIRDYP